MKEERRRNEISGFTLVELIVVLVILAILAAIGVPSLLGYLDKGKARQCEANMESLLAAYQTMLTQKNVEGVAYSLQDYVTEEQPKCPSSGELYIVVEKSTLKCPRHGEAKASGSGSVHVDVSKTPVSQPATASAAPTPTTQPKATATPTQKPTATPEPTATPKPTATPELVVTPTPYAAKGNLPIYGLGYEQSTTADFLELIASGRFTSGSLSSIIIDPVTNAVYVVKNDRTIEGVNTLEGMSEYMQKEKDDFQLLGYVKEGDYSGIYTDTGYTTLVTVYNAELMTNSDDVYNYNLTEGAQGKLVLYQGSYYVTTKNEKFSKLVDALSNGKSLPKNWVCIGAGGYTAYSGSVALDTEKGGVSTLDLDGMSTAEGLSGKTNWNKTEISKGDLVTYTVNGSRKTYVYVGDKKHNCDNITVYEVDLITNRTGFDKLFTDSDAGRFIEVTDASCMTATKNIKKGSLIFYNSKYYISMKDISSLSGSSTKNGELEEVHLNYGN